MISHQLAPTRHKKMKCEVSVAVEPNVIEWLFIICIIALYCAYLWSKVNQSASKKNTAKVMKQKVTKRNVRN